MRKYVANGVAQLQKVADMVRGLNPKRPWRIEITQHQAKRTVSQNKLYWAVIMEMADETGYAKDEMHEAMKMKFLPPSVITVAENEIVIPASTTLLGKKDFAGYVDKVIAFAAMEMGITV